VGGADYGTDRPDFLVISTISGLLLISVAVADSGVLPLAIVGAVLLLFTIGFYWDSHYLKLGRTNRLLDRMKWVGSETVLDVGCGRGLFLVNAAKRVESGLACGVDLWNPRLQTGNAPKTTLGNARIEGVYSRVCVSDGDARALPFRADSFDVTFACLVLHHIGRSEERRRALGEMDRVLKAGGRVVIIDSYLREYRKFLVDHGYTEITQLAWGPLSLLGTRTLTAIKPSAAEA